MVNFLYRPAENFSTKRLIQRMAQPLFWLEFTRAIYLANSIEKEEFQLFGRVSLSALKEKKDF